MYNVVPPVSTRLKSSQTNLLLRHPSVRPGQLALGFRLYICKAPGARVLSKNIFHTYMQIENTGHTGKKSCR